jgi:hypothetical protein
VVGGLEDRREFKQTVDVLLHGSDFVDGLSAPQLDFPIVLELRDVVGRGLDPEGTVPLIVKALPAR